MSDPFVERMMERARKRREALGHIAPSDGGRDNKENSVINSTTRTSLKDLSERYKDESKNTASFESSENTISVSKHSSPQRLEFSSSKRPTNLDSVLATKSMVPSQDTNQSSPSSRPKLGVLAARCQLMKEWDDDYRHVSPSSHDAQVGVDGNAALPKKTNCKPCSDNVMHEPDQSLNSANIVSDLSSPVSNPKKAGPDTSKYLFGENLKVGRNEEKSKSPTKSPTKHNLPSVTNNSEPRSLASVISPKKSTIIPETTTKFKTPSNGSKVKCSSNSELKQVSTSASAKKIEWDQSLINSLIERNDTIQDSLESQGFTPSDSRSRLVFDFKKEQNNSTETRHRNMRQSPSPPRPPPKVVTCVPKNPVHSPERNLSTATFLNERTRSPSPSKVVEMRSRWEQHIRNSSPDRQECRSRSPTKASNAVSPVKSASRSSLKQEHRSRSPVKSASNLLTPYRSQSPVKAGPFSSTSPVKPSSPTRSCSPHKPQALGSTIIKGVAPMPDTAPLLDDPYHSSVKDRAAAFGGAGSKKDSKKDPAEMSLQERRVLFEKQKGAALVPKAPFGQAISTKVLQGEMSSKGSQGIGGSSLAHSHPVKKPTKKLATEPSKAIAERMEEIERDEGKGGVSSFEAQRRMFESRKDNWQNTDINSKVQQERQKEMDVLIHRFRRPVSHLTEGSSTATDNSQRPTIQSNASNMQQIEHPGRSSVHEEEYDDEYEESDTSLAESNTSEDTTAPVGPPKPPRLYSGSDSSISGGSPQSMQPPLPYSSSISPSCSPSRKTEKSSPRRRSAKRLNSTEIGEDFESRPCKEFVPKVKPGCLFPSLSDIESHSEAVDSQESDDDYNIKDSSFAESVLTVASQHSLGHKIQVAAQYNGTSIGGKDLTTITEYSEGYHSTLSNSPSKVENPSISESAMDACLAIDDAIDEALTPTPPKRLRSADGDSSSNFKTPRMSSTSSPDRNSAYKTPLLQTDTGPEENENFLTHSVSLYRKQRPVEVTYTPVRKIVRSDVRSPTPEPMDSPTVTISARIRELQEEVGAQQRVISQASQAVNVVLSKPETLEGTTQHIEAEKVLLIASLKRHQALNEIQRIKAEGALGQQDVDSCSGSMSISNISLPLKQDFLQKGMKGEKIHHLLVLVKHRHQVITSQLMTTPSCVRDGQITFPNLVELSNLSSDFNIAIEVYGFSTFTNSQHNMKKEQSRMKLTPLKRLSKQDSRCYSPAVQSPGGPYAVRSSAFTLMGFTNLNIATVTRNAWTLEKVVFSSPLDGHLLMRVQCNMEGGITERGFLTMFEDVGGFGAWNRRWCVLSGKHLRYWSYPDDENKREASGSIDLRTCTNRRIELVARDVCARQHTFQLSCQRPAHKGDISNLVQEMQGDVVILKLLLSADCKEDRILWCNKLNKIVANIRAWDPDALRPEDYQV